VRGDAISSNPPGERLSAPVADAGRTPVSAAPEKVERHASAMGTSVTIVAYTSREVDRDATGRAIEAALGEIRRLESVLSEWRNDSEVGQINSAAGDWVKIGNETQAVISKALWAGRISDGSFDITFQVMSDLWKFGSASDGAPQVPSPQEIRKRRALIDYRQVELDPERQRVRIPKGRQIGLGGIAKGYIVDRAVEELRRRGLRSFLLQAGGDLYGSGRKPDGSRWVSGIQDPRGPQGSFFAVIELEDHAFSTAGDYARSYVVNGKRYHHIIDPRTGYPATACRSVTVWAKDAITADVIDDAVFILGPERGIALVDSLNDDDEDVGVVIVDARNKLWSSRRLKSRLKTLKPPTDGI
jgi:thiamine biosynthesis lipoprotein